MATTAVRKTLGQPFHFRYIPSYSIFFSWRKLLIIINYYRQPYCLERVTVAANGCTVFFFCRCSLISDCDRCPDERLRPCSSSLFRSWTLAEMSPISAVEALLLAAFFFRFGFCCEDDEERRITDPADVTDAVVDLVERRLPPAPLVAVDETPPLMDDCRRRGCWCPVVVVTGSTEAAAATTTSTTTFVSISATALSSATVTVVWASSIGSIVFNWQFHTDAHTQTHTNRVVTHKCQSPNAMERIGPNKQQKPNRSEAVQVWRITTAVVVAGELTD